MGNTILNKAKNSSNTDEWYTNYETIEKEVINYKDQLFNKIIYCNCDNPYKSEFVKFFLKNFNELKIKKLICTSYTRTDLFSESSEGLILEVDSFPVNIKTNEEIDKYIVEKGIVKQLYGNGDFMSDECIQYLKQSDILITNPPFSMFSQLFSLLVKYNKKYLLIANQNAITYKEIFPYIKNNMARVGYHFGDMSFKVPNNTEPRKTRFWIDEVGQKWRSLGNAMWITNLSVTRDNKKLKLTKRYNKKFYKKYDNYDAIHIKKVSEIPYDYDGVMGVPITFLKYHDDKEYEIVGEANHGSDNEYDLFKPKIKGKEMFKRILIKKRKREYDEI